MFLLFLLAQVVTRTETGEVMITNVPEAGEAVHAAPVSEPVECTEYDHIIAYYCDMYMVDPALIKIVIEKESEFNPNAVSSSGAIGLMQLMPKTAEILGVKDPYDPWENIEGGVKFLKYLLDTFDGNVEFALAGYHAGPGAVERAHGVPPIPETVAYVDYIMGRYSPGSRNNPVRLSITEEGTPLITNRE
ncbi:lytic transglycosylase domain-containing protein [candidate division WOR-3 bacterium]|nr:lytic transglycosylase domain-containing protein [candidate division WOR-3 bacterium]